MFLETLAERILATGEHDPPQQIKQSIFFFVDMLHTLTRVSFLINLMAPLVPWFVFELFLPSSH